MGLVEYARALPARVTTLGNGLRVVVSPDPALPVTCVELWYQVGSRHERPGRTGFAHLFEHLMFEGSASVRAGEHFASLQAVGGVVNGTTSFDRTTYYQTVPRDHVDLALWLEADRMGGLLAALTQRSLDNQRDVVKNEKRQRYDNVPYGSLPETMNALLFPPGHHYHHRPIGSMADLDAATLDDCRGFFLAHYAPDNAVLALAGDVTYDGGVEAAERYFGHLPPLGVPAAPIDFPLAPLAAPVRAHLAERVPAPLLAQGYRLPPDGTVELDAAVVALTVLGRGAGSRLHRRLLRDERLAGAVAVEVSRLAGGASMASVRVRGLPDADLDRLESVVAEEVAAIAASGPTGPELARAIAWIERAGLDELAGVTDRADALARATALHGSPGALAAAAERAMAATADAVRQAAAKWLLPDRAAVVTYQPRAA